MNELLKLACGCWAKAAPDFRDGVVIAAPAFTCGKGHEQGQFVSAVEIAQRPYGGNV